MRPHIPDEHMELLAQRLSAGGLGRRQFLQITAGLAAMGAAGFNARPASAAPKLAPGEKLAKSQALRIGGGGWWQEPAWLSQTRHHKRLSQPMPS